MISEEVMKQAVWFHGVPHFAVNVCMHCGYEDDPETVMHWPVDDDDDRVCPACAEKEGIERD